MEKKVLAVALAAVVLMTAFALATGGAGNDSSADSGVLGDLLVYGNADNDGVLGIGDIEYIGKIVSGEVSWNPDTNPYADADNDGDVDQDDIDRVSKFLRGERAVMYYTDWNMEVSKVHFPVTGGIGVAYEAGLNAGIIGGWYGQITAINKLPSEIASLDEAMYPGSHSLKSIKADSKVYDYEILLASGISLATGEPFAFDGSLLRQLERHNDAVDRNGGDGYIDPLLLPYTRDINGINWTQTIHALGVMTGNQDRTSEYFSYVDRVDGTISDAVGGDPGPETKTYLALFVGSTVFPESGTEFAVEYYIEGKENSGDVVNLERLPLKDANPSPRQTFDTVTIQQVIEFDPDVIFLVNAQNGLSQSELEDTFRKYIGYLDKTRACAEGNLIWCNFDVLGSTAGTSLLTYMASMIWPEHFDRDTGLDLMQDYFDRFTNLGGDVQGTRYFPIAVSDVLPNRVL